MATLDERLKDDDYRHWVKAVLCLQYTKDGLVSFASRKSQDLHNAVLAQLRRSGNPSAGGVCSTARIDFKKKAIVCCANCNVFLVETKRYCSGILNLNNFDVTDLHNQPWQLAKLFMNPGQDVTNTIPGQTDLSGILNFLNYCTLAKAAILNTANIIAVRDTRNRILHTANMKITKQDFTTNIIPTLIALLQDPWFLSTDQVAQSAILKINEVAAADFHITKENEERVLKDLAAEFRCLNQDLSTKIDDLRSELNRVETNVGQEMKTQQDKLAQDMQDREKDKQKLEKAVQTLEQKVNYDTELVTTLGTVVNTIKTSLEETHQDIDKLKSEIKLVKETCERQHKDLEMTYERRHKQLEEECESKHKNTETVCERKHKQLEAECKRKHEEMAADIDDLSMRVKKTKTLPITEEDKAELQQYLKDGYDINKLNVPVLGACHGVPISEIFTPVILTDTETGQEQESGQPWDTRSHNSLVAKSRRTPAIKQRTKASEKLRSYEGIFIKEKILQKKIFLLGKAGAGKSTFCKHLADVWSNDKVSPQFDDAEFMKKFRYLFSVCCRFAEASESIFDMICNQLFCENDEMIKVACHVLKNTPDECLVVVDGIDEWKGSAKEATGRRGDIPGLPSRKGLEDCVVLSTSRPERIHMLPVKLEKTCSVLELHGIKNADGLIYSILEKSEYPNPRQTCQKFLSQIKQSNMKDLIQFPMMLVNALNIWDMNETFSNSVCVNYSNMAEGLFLRARDESRIEAHQREQEKGNSAELPVCFHDTDLCKRNSGLIMRLGKLAFNLLFSDDQNLSLVFSRQQTRKYLTENELKISLAVGVLSKAQTSNRSRRRIDNFSFCHKTFQEFLGALWLSTEQSTIMSMFLRQFNSLSTVLHNKVFIQFLCGVSPSAGEEFWKYIGDEVIEKDEEVIYCRLKDIDNIPIELLLLQDMVFRCIKEARSSGGQQHPQLYYFFPDIFIYGLTAEINGLVYGLVEKYVADIKSVSLYAKIPSEVVKNMKKMKSVISIALCGGARPYYINTVPMLNFGSESVPVLQFPDQLKALKMYHLALSTLSAIEFPLHLITLAFNKIEMSHRVIEQLFSCIHVSSDLQNLYLKDLYCSDHGGYSCCLPTLNLPRLQSLVKVTLDALPVKIVRLSWQETMPIQLRTLDITGIKMSHSSFKQRYISSLDHCLTELCLHDSSVKSVLLSDQRTIFTELTYLNVASIKMPHSCIEQLFSYIHVSSNLNYLSVGTLRSSDHTASCSEHGFRCCIPTLDLQNHHSLQMVQLFDFSVEGVLLPRQLEQHTCLIFMDNINMSSQSWKRCLDSLPRQSNILKVNLECCNIDNDIRSYIRSCSHLTVTKDYHFLLQFATKWGQ